MLIFYLIPIALLAVPFIALFVIMSHSTRLKILEKKVAELKKQIESGVVVSAVKSQPVSTQADQVDQIVTPVIPQATPQAASAVTHTVNSDSAIASEDTSGKILGRIGIAAVLIGIAFFLKYAFDNNWIGPSGRVMIGIFAGVGFLGFGQYIRSKYLQYSDLLMGGGIAILYLSVFSAHSFYNLIDSPTTGVVMFLITLLAFAMSVVNATQTLALVSVIGAFATPFLVGSHENSMLTLFSYMIIINIGVLGISFFKKWPRLNLASFVGTAINFTVWFVAFYTADALGFVLGFCVVTFLIFLVAQVARVITAGVKADEADYLLIGTSAFAFALILYVLLNPSYHSVLGFVSVLIAVVYMGFAFMVNKANPEDKAINIFLPGLAVVFLSAAVPLQFSGPAIAVAWFIEACFLYGIAFVIGNRGFQVMGLIVYSLGLIDFVTWYMPLRPNSDFVPVFNTPFALFTLGVVAAYVIAYIYKTYGSVDLETQKRGILAFVIIANVLSIWGLSTQVTSYYSSQAIKLASDHQALVSSYTQYSNGYSTGSQVSQANADYSKAISSNGNISNTLVSILWTLYAAILTAAGFIRRTVSLRRFGLVLFLITAIKVLIDVWNLGELYRVISFIAFGIIALIASFGYVKYKDRLKEILSLALIIGASASFAVFSGGNVSIAHASFTPTDWQYSRSISSTDVSGFVKAILPNDISWTSKTGQPFSDIRIINRQGNEVPYVLNRSSVSTGSVMTARIIDLSSTQDGSTQFIADMNKTGVVYSALDFNILDSSSNFRRQVSVYSSDSLLPIGDSRWSLVTSNGFIFRITDPSTGQISGKYSILVSAHSSRYLKIVIGSGQEGPINVSGVTAERDIQTFVGRDEVVFDATVLNNSQKKITEVTVDLGSVGRLSNGVNLSISSKDTNYIRRVVVESSDDMNSWNTIGGGTISSISTSIFKGSSNSISYQETRARYIKLSIVNNDNPPLSVINNVGVYEPLIGIVFHADLNDSYTLYYGNPNAYQPEYDTAQLTSYIDQNNLPNVNVGPQIENASYVKPTGPVIPYTESHKSLLNIVLVLLVIIIGAGVAWYLRSYLKKDK